MEQAALALEMLNITKTFPGVRALDEVSFGCARGEVHALCGENGAGKSTLIKILGGVYQPDSGTIRLDGREVAFSHPIAARRAGISIIHQELSLLPNRSVAENIFLGIEPTRFGLLDRRTMREEARRLLRRLGSSVAPETLAGDLSIAHQQIVEIAKALAIDARILVMDEPTAALDRVDAARLLDLVRKLSAEDVSIVYISHRMPEIQAVADRVTVLKDGRTVMTAPARGSADQPARSRDGRPRSLRLLSAAFVATSGQPPRSRCATRETGDCAASVLTSAQEKSSAWPGSRARARTRWRARSSATSRSRAGRWRSAAEPVKLRNPRAAIQAGLGRLSDDRKREGLIMQQSVRDNATLIERAFANPLGSPTAGPMSPQSTDKRLIQLDVRAASFDQEAQFLSGGNQQRVIIARWLARDPEILIFCEPTRGVDVAAKAAIYKIMRDMARRGRAILMVSSDLPEIIGVSDRILVMRGGALAGELPGGAGEEDVMALAVTHDHEPQAMAS